MNESNVNRVVSKNTNEPKSVIPEGVFVTRKKYRSANRAVDRTLKRNWEEQQSDGPDSAAAATAPLPSFAADGTDLTVIRWMLAMSPEDRLRWLQTHMRGVAELRRGQSDA